MSNKTKVILEDAYLLELLTDRVLHWKSEEEAALYEKMYSNYIDCCAFDGMEFDPMKIVDNDIYNYTSVIEKGDKDFEKLLKLYNDGEYDVSCEDLDCGASYIEAVSDDDEMILIRY